MIDPHVHLRDWEQKEKESVAHGLKVAKAAGIDRVFDMPNTNPPLIDRERVLDRLSLGTTEARKLKVSYSVYAGLTKDRDQIKSMVLLHSELFPLVIGLKMFLSHSTGNMGIVAYEDQRKVMRTLADSDYKGVLAVHAEKESLNNMKAEDPDDYSSHSLARPRESEIEAVKDIIRLVKEEGFLGHLHICHISTSDAVKEVIKAKEEGISISMGATPHHALLNIEDAKDKKRGLKMNPPLRSEEDRSALFSALLDGTIDWVESDHAPHTLPDKEKGASGIPALPAMLLLMYQLKKHGADETRLKSLFGNRAIEVFGLDKEDTLIPSNPLELYMKTKDEYVISPFPERLSD